MSGDQGGSSGGYSIETNCGPYHPITDMEREAYGRMCYRAALTVCDPAWTDNAEQARELLEALELDRGLAELRARFGRQS